LRKSCSYLYCSENPGVSLFAEDSRIFPSDASGPGAPEGGVVIYIDRQLASPYGRDRYRYTQPPFEEGAPEQGYQGKADRLTPAEQDARLRGIETTHFFRLLRQHTIEGMFCDPMHGGNADMIGWQAIGYPGPYMSWSDQIDQHYGKAYRPKPRSLDEVVGYPVKPWEEAE
jgi:gluconate 2-dehydrogenase gamma chain